MDLHRAHKQRSARNQNNVAAVKAIVEADWRCTVAQVAKDTGISMASVHRILTCDLKLLKKCRDSLLL